MVGNQNEDHVINFIFDFIRCCDFWPRQPVLVSFDYVIFSSFLIVGVRKRKKQIGEN